MIRTIQAARPRSLFCLSIFLFVALFALPALAAELPKQPIDFSHKTHAADNNVTCEFCHTYARRSASSGVPPVSTCVGCHKTVKGTTDIQKAEIKKIFTYWDKKQPIRWKKIHDVPDFVIFSHKRHIKAGFDCTSCHGDVSKTKAPKPFEKAGETPQSMGWCLTCHKTAHPLKKDGKIFYKKVRKTRGSPIMKSATEKPTSKTLKGLKDCLVCHK
ncbi:MAG: hypothetical protein ACI86H_000149 [bacterium]|jgi:hypothetical protein